MPAKKDEKYGKLKAIEIVGKTKQGSIVWKCLCDCGNFIDVSSNSLITGNTKSCGCLHSESLKIMGISLRKLNTYDLSGDFGIGYTSKNEPFYFDLEDYEKIKNYTWSYNDQEYVVSHPFGKSLRMHVLIMNPHPGNDIDHVHHVRYDNRKENLRECEHFENIVSSKTYSNNKSGRKGIFWDEERKKWLVSITVNKRNIYLGRFKEYSDAVKAREEAEDKYHKEFKYK